MGLYKIEIKNSVEKDMKKIDSNNPRGFQTIKLKDSEKTYRLRVGNYRIIYQIDEKKKIVTVYGVIHRREAYR
jgi:mRNA interferase RelE/StbE